MRSKSNNFAKIQEALDWNRMSYHETKRGGVEHEKKDRCSKSSQLQFSICDKLQGELMFSKEKALLGIGLRAQFEICTPVETSS